MIIIVIKIENIIRLIYILFSYNIQMASQDPQENIIPVSGIKFIELYSMDKKTVINFSMVSDPKIKDSFHACLNTMLLRRSNFMRNSEALKQIMTTDEGRASLDKYKTIFAYSTTDIFEEPKFIDFLKKVSKDGEYTIIYLTEKFDIFKKKYPEFIIEQEPDLFLNFTKIISSCQMTLNDEITQINEYLFLGSAEGARTIDKTVNDIKYVINVTHDVPNYFESKGVSYQRISILDHTAIQICDYFDQVNQFIKKAKEEKSKIYVHCMAGISRSATLVIAYLMHEYKMTLNEAFKHVRTKRHIIEPNISFYFQLVNYEKELREKNHYD
jgi:protein-tyrosine phosphatase